MRRCCSSPCCSSGWLWGVWGLLLGAPLVAIVKVVCDRVETLKPVGELLGVNACYVRGQTDCGTHTP